MATVEYKSNKDQGLSGKGTGLRSIAEKYNLQLLDHPDDRELKPATLGDYIKVGVIGVLPPKRGRRRAIPNPVTDQLARETAMMQASGEGEATTAKLCRVLAAATTGTEHAGKFNSKYVVERARRDNPHIFQPRKAINDDDRRVEWMTFKNINDWTDAAKQVLIDLEMVKDEPGLMSAYNNCPFLCFALILISFFLPLLF